MFRLSEGQIDRTILHCREFFFAGLALMVLPFLVPQGWRIGFCSGFMLSSLAIYGTALRRWRTEPGLWMLAVLLIFLLGPCCAYLEFACWRQLFEELTRKQAARAITWGQICLSIDLAIALSLLTHTIRLAIGVSIENWKRTRFDGGHAVVVAGHRRQLFYGEVLRRRRSKNRPTSSDDP